MQQIKTLNCINSEGNSMLLVRQELSSMNLLYLLINWRNCKFWHLQMRAEYGGSPKVICKFQILDTTNNTWGAETYIMSVTWKRIIKKLAPGFGPPQNAVLPVWVPAEWWEPETGANEAAGRSLSHTQRHLSCWKTTAARWCCTAETGSSAGTSSHKPGRTAPLRP